MLLSEYGRIMGMVWKKQSKAKEKNPLTLCFPANSQFVPTNRLDKIIMGYLSLAYFVMH